MKKFAIREAAEATFYDLKTGNPIVTLDTLKITEINTTSSTEYARGGRGNPKLVGFSGDKEATATIQDALFDLKAMALLTGNSVDSELRTAFIREVWNVTEVNKAEGIKVGESIKNVKVFKNGEELEEENYEISAGVFTSKDAKAGDKFEVYGTDEKTGTRISVTSDKFPGTFRVVLDVLVRDASTGIDYPGQIIIPRAKMEDDFSFSFSPEGEPSVLDLPIEILKDTNTTDMWSLTIFDEGQINDENVVDGKKEELGIDNLED